MSAFVLDASLTMSWLLGDARPADRTYAETVLDALRDPGCAARVPTTWALEVSNVLARAEAKRFVEEAQSEALLEMLACVAIQPDDATFARALTDALRAGLPPSTARRAAPPAGSAPATPARESLRCSRRTRPTRPCARA